MKRTILITGSAGLIPLVEHEHRWEIQAGHRYRDGIDETMSINTPNIGTADAGRATNGT
jgi:hypothetical protein